MSALTLKKTQGTLSTQLVMSLFLTRRPDPACWSVHPDYDPLPHIPVVEMVSEVEVSEVESLNTQFPPK